MSFSIIVLSVLLLFGRVPQGSKPWRECDIVARVNHDLITRDDYLTALRVYREELARQVEGRQKDEPQKATDDEINSEFERTKSSVLDHMIEDLILDQRADELGLAAEPEVIKAIDETPLRPGYVDLVLADRIADGEVDWQKARAAHRRQALHDIVIQREVLLPIYYAITDEERRDYYDNHEQNFVLPGKVSLSEIFLPFEDNSKARVELDAIRLLVQLRAGGDFARAVKENTPKSRPSHATGGYLGSFATRDLKTEVADAISSLNPGQLAEPLRMESGYEIIRLDGRVPDSLRDYNEPEVREKITRSITTSRAEAARKDYIARLRNNADIETCLVKR